MELPDFSHYMLQKDFRKAAELLYAFTTNVSTIIMNTTNAEEKEAKIVELEKKLANNHAQIEKMFEPMEFDQILNQAVQTGNLKKLWDDHKHNERSINHVKNKFQEILIDLKKEQYLILFDDKVLRLKYSLKLS